ncbi:MAG: 1-deoxy-D-xylulose-5-phosphate synthase [Bacteroidales bacterium]|nr:1-deoxy-D-xylulose-5-phosphate synthase [Bacteroidales bacterium]
MEYKLLNGIEKPEDIRGLSIGELRELCTEIRDYMVRVCAETPGHLASSLGSVELIVGIHYVFDTPTDKLVFDVGHQAYAHKILTGRKDAFRTMRTEAGISGFPKMDESPYDAFGVGHSSTSISAALGYAEAAAIRKENYCSIALLGDGALTGGMAFEALNNAGASDANLLVILNDNNQSIDANRGALHNNLLKLTTSRKYNQLKDHVWNRMDGKRARTCIQRWMRSLKSWIVKKVGGDLFESLGIRYFGPIDGNDIEQVVSVLKRIREFKGPRVLHCMTKKGKGYAPAEADPTIWHAPGRFNPETGERLAGAHPRDRFQDVFGEVLCELARNDARVVGITPAMSSGCSMTEFGERYPDRFFDVGIEEEHAVTFSAGLAAAGLRPFCNIYSAFSQRAYDQIIHDVALQDLPVVLCFDRAGMVGEDGATHHGAFDMAAYRSIPNCIISSPADEMELKNLMHTALDCAHGPFIIRYPRGMAEGIEWRGKDASTYEIGKAECKVEGSRIAVIATGHCVWDAVKASRNFKAGEVAVYDFRFLKPLDEECLLEIKDKFRKVITVEDGCLKGGLYGAVCEFYAAMPGRPEITGLGIPDVFIGHGTQAGQRKATSIDTDGITAKLNELL